MGSWKEKKKAQILVGVLWVCSPKHDLKHFSSLLVTFLAKELVVGFDTLPHAAKLLFMGWQTSASGEQLLGRNDADTNPGLSSWEIQKVCSLKGRGEGCLSKCLCCMVLLWMASPLCACQTLKNETQAQSKGGTGKWKGPAMFPNPRGSKPRRFWFCSLP